MVEMQKVKSVGKIIEYKGEKLDKIILDTMAKISSIVGSTLGPGGQSVLIERHEFDLPPTVTKDGVTVFRAIGFDSSVAHVTMESARDAALKTASEAGDGTTTATILSEAIVRNMKEYCKKNPKVSPQRIMRHLDRIFKEVVEPTVKKLSKKVKLNTSGNKLLKAVAKISANGDEDLAEAVMQCFNVTGDDGNVTIETASGSSKIEVEEIEGYPIAIGYENSCSSFWPQFINDSGNQRTVLEDPVFVLYHGKLTEIQTIGPLMEAVGRSSMQENTAAGAKPFTHNVVIIAVGFSDSVLASLGANFPMVGTINIFPLVVPITVQKGSEFEFLKDVSAITGATIFDPISHPISHAKLEDLGSGIESFECGRYRSSIIGVSGEAPLLKRVDEVQKQLNNSISELDGIINRERLAKLTGGIAKLKIYGSSNGETKERRDRAEDAVCAVRGAVKHGVLPGGGWTLLNLFHQLVISVAGDGTENEEMTMILAHSLMEPFNRLISNCGIIDKNEIEGIARPIHEAVMNGEALVYDFLEQKHVNAYKNGILDSTPAVLEALRNALSIAGRLGTLGGVIVQGRDKELERSEAASTASFLRQIDDNPANERL